jgi:YebC/PmpR family DNA-binding regulatory protein
MAGHSKWKNIKRKKEAQDSKRGKIFSKISRLIMVAARSGGGDPSANPALRLAIEKAKAASMPKDNITRAINKGAGVGGDALNFEEVTYEGFGPGGEAFLVKALTDNRNRTVAEVRTTFSKAGGSLGGSGSTAYIFGDDPQNPGFTVEVDESARSKLDSLIDALEDIDDVSEVFVNFE